MIHKWIAGYANWLHLQWPAGTVEKLPQVNEDGSTNVPGIYIVGDLTGIPLLKFSADTGAKAIKSISNDAGFKSRKVSDEVLDVVIVGGGVSGFSAAMEAANHQLRYELYESSQAFSTIVNFPKGKPIYTYPTDMTPEGDLQFHDKSDVREGLIEDMQEQTLDKGIEPIKARVEQVKRKGGVFEVTMADGEIKKAHRVIVAIGRSGNYRKLNVPGEDKDKVSNRLHDPKEFKEKNVMVVGGGDSALEAAIALAENDAKVTLSYRKPEFARPKPENIEQLGVLSEKGQLELIMASNVTEIGDERVSLKLKSGEAREVENDNVFTLIGREAPLDFFRRSGINIGGEWTWKSWLGLAIMAAFIIWIYNWKGDYNLPAPIASFFNATWLALNPSVMTDAIKGWSQGYFGNDKTLGGTILNSMSGRSFYYTFLYATCVVVFGIRRIRRRKTPYITLQTLCLMAIQVIPLFILPEIVFPYLGNNGWYESGFGKWFADTFFTENREYWRAYGFILAWPLMAWNWFTAEPIMGWLILGFIQTFVLIPAMIWRWGKGSYCGWICSCGALAETLGDAHRHKMPHGPFWNKLNFIGQAFLVFATVLMVARIFGWVLPEGNWFDVAFNFMAKGSGLPFLNYAYFVDLLFAGVIGVMFYFHFSGRVWCRFACPLAALMHIYARFSQFRILVDKKKCISCNVCTSVCHQGIDIMNFANKGRHMEDPECVRCSACVQSCPTGVLTFGRAKKDGTILGKDRLAASPVQMAELTVGGKKI